MVIIAEINSLAKGLSDSQKKQLSALTAKDKFFLLCDTNATVSMDILEMFMDLKVKPQFIKIDLKDKFAVGFQYGQLSITYAKEKILVISDEDHANVFGKFMETMKTTARTAAPKKTPVKSQVTKIVVQEPVEKPAKSEKQPAKTPKAPQTPKAPAKKKNVVEMLEEKEKKTTTPAKKDAPAGKTKVRMKDLNNATLLSKYLALKPYQDKINRMGEGMIKNAIAIAQDADISFKFQLTMCFGADDGEAIWKILKKDFAKLKELA